MLNKLKQRFKLAANNQPQELSARQLISDDLASILTDTNSELNRRILPTSSTHTPIYVPKSLLGASKEEILATTNGCGPEKWNSVLVFLLSRFILGDVSDACRCHDWCYSRFGVSVASKAVADQLFLLNLIVTISEQPLARRSRLVRAIKIAKAKLFFMAVSKFGFSAFFNSKSLSVSELLRYDEFTLPQLSTLGKQVSKILD